jgi:mannonate dehydratase
MKRRDFVKVLGAGTAGAATLGTDRAHAAEREPARRRVLMKLGCQHGGIADDNLQFKARHGVFYFDPNQPRTIEGVGWDLEDAERMVDAASSYGITLAAFHLSHAGAHFRTWTNIMLGKSPERDREIEMMQQMVQVAARVGVPLLLYNAEILPVLRTQPTVDATRGNSSYPTWNYEEALSLGMDRELTEAGVVELDELYERITYWLDRLMPVAEEYNVKLAVHISDPPLPAPFRCAPRWNSPDIFAGIKRFAQLYDSPSHGFNFCIGSTAEGLRDPATEIFPIIEWLGGRRQIFNVHLRNIKGGWNHFQEVYPDNGDMNFVEVMRALQRVGYDGMVMPDHVPSHPDPESTRQAFAFAYGYIRALIQMLETEA